MLWCRTVGVACDVNAVVQGCWPYMEDELRVHLNIMSAVGLGLCCLQVVNLLLL